MTTDGTYTHCFIETVDEWGEYYPIGIGLAKRRKGDRRDVNIGTRLALRRAFQDAIEGVSKDLKALGMGEAK